MYVHIHTYTHAPTVRVPNCVFSVFTFLSLPLSRYEQVTYSIFMDLRIMEKTDYEIWSCETLG